MPLPTISSVIAWPMPLMGCSSMLMVWDGEVPLAKFVNPMPNWPESRAILGTETAVLVSFNRELACCNSSCLDVL